VQIRVDNAGPRVVPLRGRADAPVATRRRAPETPAAVGAVEVADVSGARDLVRAVAGAVRGQPNVGGSLHGPQRAAVLSLLA